MYENIVKFITEVKTGKFVRCGYVYEPDFYVYLRYSKHWINSTWIEPCLDIANIEVYNKGNGTFTALLTWLRDKYPNMNIYVESVLNTRLRNKLLALGFTRVGGDEEFNYWLPSEKEPK